MRKVIRGYAKDKNLNLVPIGTIPVPHSKGKRSPAARQDKDIWSDKEQQSLRKKLFVSRPYRPTICPPASQTVLEARPAIKFCKKF
jgi:hypothetical protein